MNGWKAQRIVVAYLRVIIINNCANFTTWAIYNPSIHTGRSRVFPVILRYCSSFIIMCRENVEEGWLTVRKLGRKILYFSYSQHKSLNWSLQSLKTTFHRCLLKKKYQIKMILSGLICVPIYTVCIILLW